MGNEFLYRLIRPSIILGIFSVVIGCASTPSEQETFKGEGFQSSLPKAGTRVVVWGNHSGAVSRTLGWLQDHQILGVDRSLIENELTDPGFALRTRSEQHVKVLAAAKSVGAPLVLFAQVEDSQLFRKFDLMSFGHKRMKIIEVEIRAMKAETGDVVFGGKAWNSEPLVESDQIVQDLTTLALQKAWNESDRPLPLQQEVAQPTPPQQEEVSVASSYSAEMQPTLEPFKSETVESQSFEEEPSLGLQIAGGALSVLYTPLKVGYAGLGGFMGGLAYLLSAGNEQVAQSIWEPSLNGTYWLTARHLQGEEAIHFMGEPSQIDPIHQARLDEAMAVGAVAE